MIGLDTGTPGAGKTLINVYDIIQLEKTNKKNLRLNPKIYSSTKDILESKSLLDELLYLERDVGQGLTLSKESLLFDSDFFNFFTSEERIEDYFERSIYFNEIIDRINDEYGLKLPHIKPVRTIYTNIKGLKVDYVRSLPSDSDWRKLPDGSFIVIDEIQNIDIFSSETKSVSPIVKDLTIHRHRAFDIKGITQFPSLVHPVFRNLVGHHRHLVNSFGLKSSTVYEWSTCKTDPNALRNKITAEIKTTFKFPKEIYKYYSSSTAHTHKLRLPLKFIFLILGALLFLLILFIYSIQGENIAVKIATGGAYGNASESKSNSDTTSDNKQKTSSPLQEKNEVPVSEPVFNSASEPVLSYDPSRPYDFSPIDAPSVVNHRIFSGCLCSQKVCYAVDQQGTKIKSISKNVCKDIMKNSSNRPFDYFRDSDSIYQKNLSINEANRTRFDKPDDNINRGGGVPPNEQNQNLDRSFPDYKSAVASQTNQ